MNCRCDKRDQCLAIRLREDGNSDDSSPDDDTAAGERAATKDCDPFLLATCLSVGCGMLSAK